MLLSQLNLATSMTSLGHKFSAVPIGICLYDIKKPLIALTVLMEFFFFVKIKLCVGVLGGKSLTPGR